jgi:hypothetical protein
MRVTSYLPLLCVFGNVFAAPVNNIEARDTKAVLAAISSITKSLQEMSASINALYRNPTNNDVVSQLKVKATSVTGEMTRGTASVTAGPAIEFFEALSLTMPLGSLGSATDTALNAWLSAKNTIVKTGGREQVLRILRDQGIAADGFTDAVVSKLPQAYKYIGREYGDLVSARLRSTIDQFRA